VNEDFSKFMETQTGETAPPTPGPSLGDVPKSTPASRAALLVPPTPVMSSAEAAAIQPPPIGSDVVDRSFKGAGDLPGWSPEGFLMSGEKQDQDPWADIMREMKEKEGFIQPIVPAGRPMGEGVKLDPTTGSRVGAPSAEEENKRLNAGLKQQPKTTDQILQEARETQDMVFAGISSEDLFAAAEPPKPTGRGVLNTREGMDAGGGVLVPEMEEQTFAQKMAQNDPEGFLRALKTRKLEEAKAKSAAEAAAKQKEDTTGLVRDPAGMVTGAVKGIGDMIKKEASRGIPGLESFDMTWLDTAKNAMEGMVAPLEAQRNAQLAAETMPGREEKAPVIFQGGKQVEMSREEVNRRGQSFRDRRDASEGTALIGGTAGTLKGLMGMGKGLIDKVKSKMPEALEMAKTGAEELGLKKRDRPQAFVADPSMRDPGTGEGATLGIRSQSKMFGSKKTLTKKRETLETNRAKIQEKIAKIEAANLKTGRKTPQEGLMRMQSQAMALSESISQIDKFLEPTIFEKAQEKVKNAAEGIDAAVPDAAGSTAADLFEGVPNFGLTGGPAGMDPGGLQAGAMLQTANDMQGDPAHAAARAGTLLDPGGVGEQAMEGSENAAAALEAAMVTADAGKDIVQGGEIIGMAAGSLVTVGEMITAAQFPQVATAMQELARALEGVKDGIVLKAEIGTISVDLKMANVVGQLNTAIQVGILESLANPEGPLRTAIDKAATQQKSQLSSP